MGNIINSTCSIRYHALEVQFPVQYVDGYLEWYLIVSHPRVVILVEYADGVGPSDIGGHSDDVPSPPPGVAD